MTVVLEQQGERILPTEAIDRIWEIVDNVEPCWRENVMSFASHRYGEDGSILPMTETCEQVRRCIGCEHHEVCGENLKECRLE